MPATTQSARTTADTRGWRLPAAARRTCPPSSWPIGSRFRHVTSRPNHAAMNVGCSCTVALVYGPMCIQSCAHRTISG